MHSPPPPKPSPPIWATRAESGTVARLRPSRPGRYPGRSPCRHAFRPLPITRHVARVTRGLTRAAAATRPAPQQAAGLTSEALAAVRATAHLPRTGPGGRTESADAATRRGAMDVAIASTMRDALLRRSEAAALRWADVELLPDGTGRVAIRRSKTDQEGEGAVQFLGTGAASAVAAIRPEVPEPTGRVFGVSGRTLARRIAAAAKAAGLHGAFSGHSGQGWNGSGSSGRWRVRCRRSSRGPMGFCRYARQVRTGRTRQPGSRRRLLPRLSRGASGAAPVR